MPKYRTGGNWIFFIVKANKVHGTFIAQKEGMNHGKEVRIVRSKTTSSLNGARIRSREKI
jgi:hypothetical protein